MNLDWVYIRLKRAGSSLKGTPAGENAWNHHLLNSSLFTASNTDIENELRSIDEWLANAQEELSNVPRWYKNPTTILGGVVTCVGIFGFWIPVLGIAATTTGAAVFLYDVQRTRNRQNKLLNIRSGIERISLRRRRINLELSRRANSQGIEIAPFEEDVDDAMSLDRKGADRRKNEKTV